MARGATVVACRLPALLPLKFTAHCPPSCTPIRNIFISPSRLQWCGWQGGVWDDIDIVNWDSAGGRCISYAQREEILATRSDVEEVIVLLSNDGNVSGERKVWGEAERCDGWECRVAGGPVRAASAAGRHDGRWWRWALWAHETRG